MKLGVEKVTVTIDRDEALSIINAINHTNDGINKRPELVEAHKFAALLQGAFMNQVAGVHVPK